jgi:hypothetical protein
MSAFCKEFCICHKILCFIICSKLDWNRKHHLCKFLKIKRVDRKIFKEKLIDCINPFPPMPGIYQVWLHFDLYQILQIYIRGLHHRNIGFPFQLLIQCVSVAQSVDRSTTEWLGPGLIESRMGVCSKIC